MYPRIVKVRSSNGTVNEYVRVVEAYRENGKVKQRVIADLGRKDLLLAIASQAPTSARGEKLLERMTLQGARRPGCLDLGASPRRPDLVRPARPLEDPR